VLTGILLRNSSSYQQTDIGFDPQGICYPIGVSGWDKATSGRLLQALQAEPAVESVSFVLNPPLGATFKLPVLVAGGSAAVDAGFNLVSPEYFHQLSLPILQGRALTAEESQRGLTSTAQVRSSRRRWRH
jgi:hypothetical protein